MPPLFHLSRSAALLWTDPLPPRSRCWCRQSYGAVVVPQGNSKNIFLFITLQKSRVHQLWVQSTAPRTRHDTTGDGTSLSGKFSIKERTPWLGCMMEMEGCAHSFLASVPIHSFKIFFSFDNYRPTLDYLSGVNRIAILGRNSERNSFQIPLLKPLPVIIAIFCQEY